MVLTIGDVQEVLNTTYTPLAYIRGVPHPVPKEAVCTPRLFKILYDTVFGSAKSEIDDQFYTQTSLVDVSYAIQLHEIFEEASYANSGAYGRIVIDNDLNGMCYVGMSIPCHMLYDCQVYVRVCKSFLNLIELDINKFNCFVDAQSVNNFQLDAANVGVSITNLGIVMQVNDNYVDLSSMNEDCIVYAYFELPFTIREIAGDQFSFNNNGEQRTLQALIEGIKNKATVQVHSTTSSVEIDNGFAAAYPTLRAVTWHNMLVQWKVHSGIVSRIGTYAGGYSMYLGDDDSAPDVVIVSNDDTFIYYTLPNNTEVYYTYNFNETNVLIDAGSEVLDMCGVGDRSYVIICTDTELICACLGIMPRRINLPSLEDDEIITAITCTYNITTDTIANTEDDPPTNTEVVVPHYDIVLHTSYMDTHYVYVHRMTTRYEFLGDWTLPTRQREATALVLQTYKYNSTTVVDLIMQGSELYLDELTYYSSSDYTRYRTLVSSNVEGKHLLSGYANTIHGVYAIVDNNLYEGANSSTTEATLVRELPSGEYEGIIFNSAFDKRNIYIVNSVPSVGDNTITKVSIAPEDAPVFEELKEYAGQHIRLISKGVTFNYYDYGETSYGVYKVPYGTRVSVYRCSGGVLNCYSNGLLDLTSDSSEPIVGTTGYSGIDSACICDGILYYCPYNDAGSVLHTHTGLIAHNLSDDTTSNDITYNLPSPYNDDDLPSLYDDDDLPLPYMPLQMSYLEYHISVVSGVVRAYVEEVSMQYEESITVYAYVGTILGNAIDWTLVGVVENVHNVSPLNTNQTNLNNCFTSIAMQLYDDDTGVPSKIVCATIDISGDEPTFVMSNPISIEYDGEFNSFTYVAPCVNEIRYALGGYSSLYFWVYGIGLYRCDLVPNKDWIAKCVYATADGWYSDILSQDRDLNVIIPNKLGVYRYVSGNVVK